MKILKQFLLFSGLALTLSSCATVGDYYSMQAQSVDLFKTAPHYVSHDYDQQLIIEAKPDKWTVYPDEQIILSYDLFTRYDTRFEGVDKEERVPPFWFKNAEMTPANVKTEQVYRNEKKYIRATTRKKFFFARKPGTYTLSPAELKISIRKQHPSTFAAFFARPAFSGLREAMYVGAPDIQITVLDFPAPPANFMGSSGNYTIAGSLEQREPKDGIFVYRVTVSGEGNLWNVNLKMPDLGGLHLLSRDEEVEDKGLWDRGVVTGKKVFTYRFAAKQPGEYTVPPFHFTYFDPVKKEYQNIFTQPVPVKTPVSVPEAQKYNSGLAVVLDFSGSMMAEDIGKRSRLNTAKDFAVEIMNNASAEWYGAVLFAATLEEDRGAAADRRRLTEFIAAERKLEQDGTAIGDAIQTALKNFEQYVQPNGIKKILLIGDGTNNNGHIEPVEAAKMAAEQKVVIYSVVVGSGQELVPFPIIDPIKGPRYVQADVEVVTEDLEEAARLTGGKSLRIANETQIAAVRLETQELLK